MLFGTVNSHEQVCDQAGKDLDHNSISASRNEMVNVETLFPPGKEFLDFPSQFVDSRDLFCCQIHAVCNQDRGTFVPSVLDELVDL